MKVYVGADYRGLERKAQLVKFLKEKDVEAIDEGDFEYREGSDFNDSAIAVAKAVLGEPDAFGILICDSAHGMTMQANRFRGIRAAHCDSAESAKLAREHDDANVLTLSAHFTNEEEMQKIVETFLSTKFTNLERRVRRIKRLDEKEIYD